MKNERIMSQEKSASKNRDIVLWQKLPFLKRKHLYFFLIAAIFLIGILARTHHLSSLPPGIYPDEAVNATDAIHANETGHYRLFYPNNYGREGFYINLIAWGFLFFGVNIITLKMWSVFFGILTIAGMMLLARELFRTYRAGLIAGFLYATSFWALNFSRIAFRANMLPFVLVFTFYFLWKSLRTRKIRDAILAGLFFGLGAHTYIAFRVAPFILIALLPALMVSRKNFLRNYWKKILAFFLTALIVALPILIDFYLHPQYFETRSQSVSVFSPQVNRGHLWSALGNSISLSFRMFNFQGDRNWRHNFSLDPELEFYAGILFLAGIFLILGRFFYHLYLRLKKKKYPEDFAKEVLLISWFLVMLLPAILAYESLPHSLRAIGVLPAAYLFATYGAETIFQLADRLRMKYFKFFIYLALAAIITWSGYASVRKYFVDWASRIEIHTAFSQNMKNMGLFLNNLSPRVNKYVVANSGGQIMDDGLPVAAHVVEFLTHYNTPGIVYLLPNFDANLLKAPAKIVMMYYNGEVVAKVKDKFPNAFVQKLDPQPGNGTDYFVININ